MKNSTYSGLISVLIFAMMCLSSCELVEGIFKAGVWTGFLVVALVIGLIIFIIAKIGKKN